MVAALDRSRIQRQQRFPFTLTLWSGLHSFQDDIGGRLCRAFIASTRTRLMLRPARISARRSKATRLATQTEPGETRALLSAVAGMVVDVQPELVVDDAVTSEDSATCEVVECEQPAGEVFDITLLALEPGELPADAELLTITAVEEWSPEFPGEVSDDGIVEDLMLRWMFMPAPVDGEVVALESELVDGPVEGEWSVDSVGPEGTGAPVSEVDSFIAWSEPVEITPDMLFRSNAVNGTEPSFPGDDVLLEQPQEFPFAGSDPDVEPIPVDGEWPLEELILMTMSDPEPGEWPSDEALFVEVIADGGPDGVVVLSDEQLKDHFGEELPPDVLVTISDVLADPGDTGVEYLAMMPSAASGAGSPEVQRNLNTVDVAAPASQDAPGVMLAVQRNSGVLRSVFASQTKPSTVELVQQSNGHHAEAPPARPTRPVALRRGRSSTNPFTNTTGHAAPLSLKALSSALSESSEQTPTSEAATRQRESETPADARDEPAVPHRPSQAEADSTRTNPRPVNAVAVRFQGNSIDQFMSQFAQDSFAS
jgi:hypothetical protein